MASAPSWVVTKYPPLRLGWFDVTARLTFLILDLCLDIFDGVAGLNLKGDGLPRQRLHEDLHDCRLRKRCH